MNFIDYSNSVMQKLREESISIEKSVVSGMAPTLEQYKYQTGTLRGINFCMNVMQDVRNSWLKDGMKPCDEQKVAV